MKVLHRAVGTARLQYVLQRITLSSGPKCEVSGQNRVCQQGRTLCRSCYNSLCGQRTPAKPSSQYLAVYNNHGFLSNIEGSSPLQLDSTWISDGRFNCKMSGVISHRQFQKRLLNSGSFRGLLSGKYSMKGIFSSSNCSAWNHVDIKGVKKWKQTSESNDTIINPIEKLQPFVAVPLLAKEDYIFKPSVEEIAAGQDLFIPKPKHKIEFLKSALWEEHLPVYDLPEVAFIGRSNVGKSSLIQMMLSHSDVMVKVSQNPGHTKMLNFFKVGKKFTLVDMPGYGFNMPKHYASSVEKFLSSRKKLSRTLIMIDSTAGVTENDVIGLNMLEEFQIPYIIVMTKIDKNRPSTLLRSLMTVLQYRNKTQYCFRQPFMVSSISGEGVPLLQAFIAYVTGNVKIQGL